MEQHIPSAGIRLLYEDGDVCEVTGKRRRTIIDLPCDPDGDNNVPPAPARGYEGEKQSICNYHAEFIPSKSFCPTLRRGLVADYNPVITAGEFEANWVNNCTLRRVSLASPLEMYILSI